MLVATLLTLPVVAIEGLQRGRAAGHGAVEYDGPHVERDTSNVKLAKCRHERMALAEAHHMPRGGAESHQGPSRVIEASVP